jgi:hypothetical protein
LRAANPLCYSEFMSEFRYINDIVDWLEPMDYETFWQEIKPYCLVMIPRAKCGAMTESGVWVI